MESLKTTYAQLQKLFLSLSASQRGTLALVTLMLPAAFYFLVMRESTSTKTPVLFGRQFTSEERQEAETALFNANLNDFEPRGGQILVPSNEVDRYNATLVAGGLTQGPGSFSSPEEEMLNNSSIFSSTKEMDSRMKLAQQEKASRIINAFPFVSRANVQYTPGKKTGFSRKGQEAKASIHIQPIRGYTLNQKEATNIIKSMASFFPGVTQENITLQDLSTTNTFTIEDANDPLSDQVTKRGRYFEQQKRDQLLNQLSYIPNVQIEVSVDLDKVLREVTWQQEINKDTSLNTLVIDESNNSKLSQNAPRANVGVRPNSGQRLDEGNGPNRNSETTHTKSIVTTQPGHTISQQVIVGAMPKSTRVSVVIPEEHLIALAEKENAALPPDPTGAQPAVTQAQLDTIGQKEIKNVKEVVQYLLGIPADLAPSAISVISAVSTYQEPPPASTPIQFLILEWLKKWGGASVMVLLAIWVLRSLTKSIPQLPDLELETAELTALSQPEEVEEEEEKPSFVFEEGNERENIQTVIKDNPEMTAAIISNWIRNY